MYSHQYLIAGQRRGSTKNMTGCLGHHPCVRVLCTNRSEPSLGTAVVRTSDRKTRASIDHTGSCAPKRRVPRIVLSGADDAPLVGRKLNLSIPADSRCSSGPLAAASRSLYLCDIFCGAPCLGKLLLYRESFPNYSFLKRRLTVTLSRWPVPGNTWSNKGSQPRIDAGMNVS